MPAAHTQKLAHNYFNRKGPEFVARACVCACVSFRDEARVFEKWSFRHKSINDNLFIVQHRTAARFAQIYMVLMNKFYLSGIIWWRNIVDIFTTSNSGHVEKCDGRRMGELRFGDEWFEVIDTECSNIDSFSAYFAESVYFNKLINSEINRWPAWNGPNSISITSSTFFCVPGTSPLYDPTMAGPCQANM